MKRTSLHRGAAALLALAAASCAGEGKPPPAAPWLDVFPAYPGARKLCAQHVTGTPMHIAWTAYVTSSPTAEVAAFYEKNRGGAAIERKGDALTLRGPSDKVLSVHPREGSYPTCDVAPGAADATVIIVSQAIR